MVGQYIKGAKWLSFFAMLSLAGYILISRQLFVIFTIGGTAGTGAVFNKRADTPPDMQLTKTWLTGLLGGVVDANMAFILLNVWNAFCIPFMGMLLYLIVQSTDNPSLASTTTSDEPADKNGVWWHHPGQTCLRLLLFLKSSVTNWGAIVAMDSKFQSIPIFWSKLNWFTVVRVILFLLQIIVGSAVLRLTSATMSIVAGSSTPVPSGPDIAIILPYITESAKTITPNAAFLLLVAVIAMLVPGFTVSWHALLNPRKRIAPDPDTTRWQRIKNTFNIKAFNIFGDKTPPWLFEAFLIVLVLASFATGVVYFSQIVQYAATSSVVTSEGLTDYSGIMGANLIFGLFTLPVGWVLRKIWDAVKRRVSGWREKWK